VVRCAVLCYDFQGGQQWLPAQPAWHRTGIGLLELHQATLGCPCFWSRYLLLWACWPSTRPLPSHGVGLTHRPPPLAPPPPRQVVLYTVDGASLLPVVRGTLPGGELLTTVDFGPTTDVDAAFALQRRWVLRFVLG
jgi:hypothetical protein